MKSKKKQIIIVTAFFILLSINSCTTTGTITTPVDKGTLEYKDYEYITFTNDIEVELVFISSENLPSSVLQVEKIAYYPGLNETKYKITSQTITPDHTFTPDVKTFIYQDINTGQLYTISVDYTDITTPLSPLEIAYDELLTNYQLLTMNYTELVSVKEILTNINTTITSYVTNNTINNTSNMTLEIAIATILSDLTTTTEEYRTTKNKLDNLTEDHNELSSKYTQVYNEQKEIKTQYNELLVDHANITTNFEEVKNRLQNTSGLLLQYQQFENNMQSLRTDFYFNNRHYYTPHHYNQQIQQLEGEIGLIPIYLAIAVILTVLACYLYYKRAYGDRPLSSVEKDVDYNYPEEASLFDRFSMHKLFGKLKKKTNPKLAENAVFNPDAETIVTNDDDIEEIVETETVENPDVNPLSDYVDDNDESTPVETIMKPDEQNRVVTQKELDKKISQIHDILDSLKVKTG